MVAANPEVRHAVRTEPGAPPGVTPEGRRLGRTMTAPFAADARTPVELLHAYLRGGTPSVDPAAPLVTFYDDATGERVELSARTFDNWVAKTANLLQDELNAGPGDRDRKSVV